METGDKRQSIMSSALRLFAERGFHGAPTSAIAAEAGIGVGTIYRYFKDKDDLIHQLSYELHQRYQQRIMAGFNPNLPPRDRFLRAVKVLLQLFIATPAEFRFMELYYYSPYATSAPSSCPEDDSIIPQAIRDAKSQGMCKDLPLNILKALAWGPLVALAKEYGNRDLVVDERIIALTAQASWDAISIKGESLP